MPKRPRSQSSDDVNDDHQSPEQLDTNQQSTTDTESARNLLISIKQLIRRHQAYADQNVDVCVMIPISNLKVLSMQTTNGTDTVFVQRHKRYIVSLIRQWINNSTEQSSNINRNVKLKYQVSQKYMQAHADSYVNQIYDEICDSFAHAEGNVNNMSVSRSEMWSRTQNWWHKHDGDSDWIDTAKKVNVDAVSLEQSSRLGQFMSIVSRALVVHKLKQCSEPHVWLDFAKDCGIECPSSWNSLGSMFTIMFPGCLEDDGPNKQDFDSGRALSNSPVRYLGWSHDIWFRFASAGKYLFTLFPAINRFMSDHATQSPTSSSPVSVHLSLSDDTIKVESIAQTSDDSSAIDCIPQISSDDDYIPSYQP